MPTATASDVRVEINTYLSDAEIEGDSNDASDDGILGVIERDIDRTYTDPGFEDTAHRRDFEAVLCALRIAEGRDRRAESETSGRTTTEYETSTVESLRRRVRRLDPGSEFGHPGSITRDTDRHIASTSDVTDGGA